MNAQNAQSAEYTPSPLLRPFADAAAHVFATMARIQVTALPSYERDRSGPTAPEAELLGIIGVTGGMVGTVTFGTSMHTARALLGRMLGKRCPDPALLTDEDLADGVGELVNLVAGSGKGSVAASTGLRLDISVPTVLKGTGVRFTPDRWPVAVLPFETPDGKFCVEIVLVPG